MADWAYEITFGDEIVAKDAGYETKADAEDAAEEAVSKLMANEEWAHVKRYHFCYQTFQIWQDIKD